MVVPLLVAAVLFLAYANGANDNFKGVATLYGSRTASYRVALAWATVTTLAGSALALALASGLTAAFSGKGLVPDEVAARPAYLVAVAVGAGLTVLLASRLGLPVSTTHALTGGLVGAGLVAAGGEVRFAALGQSFLLPLLLSPVLAITLTVLVYPVLRGVRRRAGVAAGTCAWAGGGYEEVVALTDGSPALRRTGERLTSVEAASCRERYVGRVLGADAGAVADGLHYLSAGAVCFARALNDTPKLLTLLLAVGAVAPDAGLAVVGLSMAVGGVLNARRVAETMATKITAMNVGQGLTGNVVTAVLVAGASKLGLPVSTTHVSVGALFGIGAVTGTARVRTVLTILVAWVTTLPLGAALSAVAYATLDGSGVAQ
jgi:PiT family inorganic phosphate transporter